MDERVIEAAITAYLNAPEFGDDEKSERVAMEAAILAADRARAEAVKRAVDTLGMAAFNWGDDQSWDDHSDLEEQVVAARRDLLALLGIEE